MKHRDWNELYDLGHTPWEDGEPWAPLGRIVQQLLPDGGRILDVGCGVGTQALHLAKLGYDVLGVDLSSRAIEAARKLTIPAGNKLRFQTADIVTSDTLGTFDLVFDRSVMSPAPDAESRAVFAQRVADLLVPSGWWVDVTGCADNRRPDGGPDPRGYPRHSLTHLAEVCEPSFEIISVTREPFGESSGNDFTAWVLVMKARRERRL